MSTDLPEPEAPKTTPQRNQLYDSLKQTLGFSDKRASRFLYNLEKNRPQKPNPSLQDIKAAVEASLTPGDIFDLKRRGYSIDQAVEEIAPEVQEHYLAPKVPQPQQFSQKADKWSKKLGKKGHDVNPVLIDNLLKGVPPESLDPNIDINKFPGRLRRQIKRAQFKVKIASLRNKYNPFAHFKRWRQKHNLFLPKLPQKLSPRYWARPAYWARKGLSKGFLKLGEKLGEKALGKAFSFAGGKLAKYGFKQLLSKGAAWLLGAAAGAATGGIATVVIAAAKIGFSFVKSLFSKKGREDLRKKFGLLFNIGSKALIGVGGLIAQFPLVFALGGAGATIGGFIGGVAGPAGAISGAGIGFTVGAGIGFILDKAVHWLKGAAQTITSAVSGATGEAAVAAAGAAPEAGAAAMLAEPAIATSAAGVGAVIVGAGGALLTTTLLASNFAARDVFGPPEGMVPWETDYIKIEKVADKKKLDNSDLATPQTITYTITITPKKEALTNIQVKDEVIIETNQTPKPTVPQITLVDPTAIPSEISQPTSLKYQISNIGQAYQDTRIRNTFTLTANIGDAADSATAFASVEVGAPPQPDAASLAFNIVDILLNKCLDLEKVKNQSGAVVGAIVDKAHWPIAKQCLINAGITDPLVLTPLENNFSIFNLLQCVQFAMASSRSGLPGKDPAKLYCQKSTAGYQLLKDWGQLQEGDFIVSQLGDTGHIAVVYHVDDHIIKVAEAMGDTGVVQFRSLGLEIVQQRYCGFLKKV